MMKLAQQPLKTMVPRSVVSATSVTRFTFIEGMGIEGTGVEGAGGRRRFTQPRSASVVEESVAVESVAPLGDGPEPGREIVIVCVPEGSSSQSRERAKALLAEREDDDASRAITLEHGSDVIDWRPGLAILQCRDESRNGMISALIDFAFYEGELRALEQSVEVAETQARTDVALAHRVRYRARGHWERLTDCAESCSRMRLTFARLEPQLLAASRTLAPAARSWMTRLLQKSETESRLESLNDRLEALEELYEGATQRIAEYRWYMGGHALEIAIIGLLLIECVMMGADMHMHNRDRQDSRSPSSAAEVRAE